MTIVAGELLRNTVNSGGFVPSEQVIADRIGQAGIDYRIETEGFHPVESLQQPSLFPRPVRASIGPFSRMGSAQSEARIMAKPHTWELWIPEPGATGVLFARARVQPTDIVWTHGAPPTLAVTVREDDDRVVARGTDLTRSTERLPMTRLALSGDTIVREDRWPNDADLGSVVILPGGEAGVLKSWWNAPDESAWRWLVEFYNHV